MDVRFLAREVSALMLGGVVLALILALYSFSPADPSLNHETARDAENMVGSFGAYISDFFYQLFGYASWIWLALLVVLTIRIVWGRKPYLGGWNSLFWLPVILTVSTFIHVYMPSGSAGDLLLLPAGTGGASGSMINAALEGPLGELGRDILLLTLLISSLVAATRLSFLRLIHQIYTWVAIGAGFVFDRVSQQMSRAAERKDRIEAREVRQEKRKSRPEKIVKAEPAEVVKPLKVEVSKRAKQQQQTELMFQEQSESGFKLPSLTLFDAGPAEAKEHHPEALQAIARMLEKKLLDYRVEGTVIAVHPGPVVTQFELEPAPGTKVNRIVALQDDLARSMAAISVRVAGNIPGKNVIGIEIPNEERETVVLRQVMASKAFANPKHILPLALGVDIGGQPVVTDLARMPHLLVAGTTGSGKSVAVNGMICSMLMTRTPQDLRLIMVDPKMLELSVYDDIPHLLVPVVTNPTKAAKALAWAVYEMERRYQLMSDAKVRNIEGYNKAAEKDEEAERLPFIVIVIDELADLMMVAGKEVEQAICRIAQKARAAGLHLILATQRPSVDVITGLIKANLPSRLSFQVSSKIDSRTILDQMGAEQLLGQGDSLFLSGGRDLKRVHGAFVSDHEVLDLVEHLKGQGAPDYREEVFEVASVDAAMGVGSDGGDDEHDEKYDEAAALVIEKGSCSVSMVQRYLRIGYNRASRLVEQMERQGLVSPPGSGGVRKVLARSEGGVIE